MLTTTLASTPTPIPLFEASVTSALPAAVVAANTAEGELLLREANSADHGPLLRWFERQEKPTFCSVASSCITMNALFGYDAHDQGKFFKTTVEAIRTQRDVEINGMTLSQLGSVLLEYRAWVSVRHAADETLDDFRHFAVDNLQRADDFLIVNYRREILGQNKGGHFSPLAAWHEASDRFLVLDVADYKYPPVWVPAATLFAAMQDVDTVSGRSRGYLAISL